MRERFGSLAFLSSTSGCRSDAADCGDCVGCLACTALDLGKMRVNSAFMRTGRLVSAVGSLLSSFNW